MAKSKKPPIPIYRRDGSQYEGDDFDAMHRRFTIEFEHQAAKFTRLLVEDNRTVNEIVLAAMIQGMAYVTSNRPINKNEQWSDHV